jgi:hypothetical protein
MEAFFAFYSGNQYEKFMFMNRAFGPYGWSYWLLVATNIVIPQLLWIRRVRLNTILLFLLSIDVLVGMWFERFVIVVTSLHRDFLPSSWGHYVPTKWDLATYGGTITLFFFLFLLFIRVMPMISIFEMRTLLPESKVKEEVAAHD